jgi:hypothetical protein
MQLDQGKKKEVEQCLKGCNLLFVDDMIVYLEDSRE